MIKIHLRSCQIFKARAEFIEVWLIGEKDLPAGKS